MRKRLGTLLLLVAGALAGGRAYASVTDYRFDVLLDEARIGSHAFRVERDRNGTRQVAIDAAFDVRLLFVPVYSYRHQNVEHWSDGCLVGLVSTTDDNGRAFAVRARAENDGLRVDAGGTDRALQGCVRSFAYWDRDFLQAERLLNSQDGALVDVDVQGPLYGEFRIGEHRVAGERFRISAETNLVIDVWYAADGSWLGLETEREGRTIRYVPQGAPLHALHSDA